MKKADRVKFYNKKELKVRFWNDTIITKWLKKADEELNNPMYSSAPSVKLFLKTRVHKQEKNKRFTDYLESNKNRRTSAQKRAKKRKLEKEAREKEYLVILEESVENVLFKNLPKNIVSLAIDSYNNWNDIKAYNYWNHDYQTADLNSDKVFLRRITKNHIRHQYTDYDFLVARMHRVHQEIPFELKQKVLDNLREKINNHYSQKTVNSSTTN